jgi:HTH-type transcriptional regulator, sugar sensing transcriptional regulator
MSLAQKLEQLGLAEKESRIYVTLLEMGESTPQQIALQSGINRATTYVILEALKNRKLINSVIKKKKSVFKVENPLSVLDFLEKEKREIEYKINIARGIMPELEMIERLTKEKAKVKFLEGREGVILIQKDLAKSKPKTYDNIFNINNTLKYFPVYEGDHRETISRKNIVARVIVVYDPKEPIPKLPLYRHEERRYLPINKFPFEGDLIFYNNKVALVSAKDQLLGVLIENKIIVDGLKTLFELAWQGAEKYRQVKENENKK